METGGDDIAEEPTSTGNGDETWDDERRDEVDIVDDEEEEVVKPVNKVKQPGVPKVRKEHINVVFIGHVGRYYVNVTFLVFMLSIFQGVSVVLCVGACYSNSIGPFLDDRLKEKKS